ncbi:MAG: hypothetical protein NC548_26015 [Lachnospiraceae bacterium]|nr:hypothetical protein [Lachnospiraceae bacterium]
MKVYCVFQPSGCYDTLSYTLTAVCATKQLAEREKEKIDTQVVTKENLWTIIPVDVFNKWPHVCTNDEEDIWEPEETFENYTLKQYEEQMRRLEYFYKKIYPADIVEFDLIEN